MQILEFIFQDFWHWLGTLILLFTAGGCLASWTPVKIIKASADSKEQ